MWEPKHGIRSVDVLETDTDVPRDYLPVAMGDRVDWRKKAGGGGGGGGGY